MADQKTAPITGRHTPVAGGLALRFISGKYQGGEVPLNRKELVVGRSSDLDLVLIEDMVSRRHARFLVDGTAVTLQDLGSTNGTFVNGEKVKQSRLSPGDRILIGTSILKLVITSTPGTDSLDPQGVRDRLEKVAASHARTSTGVMSGRLEEVPLPDLLQLFSTSKKTGLLIISHRKEGRIYLKQGRVCHASIDADPNLGPRKAFFRILGWEQGSFVLQPPDNATFDTEIEEATEALLMDSLRQLDEFRKFEAQLPTGGVRLRLAEPLKGTLRELKPEELDVLQLAINHNSAREVFDRSLLSDRDACEILLRLCKQGYLEAG
jgi:pSer/pThr/pTyr-binding forkhead associated (FHA) protein